MQTTLFDEAHFDGSTYEAEKDKKRLTHQLTLVRTLMLDGRWRSLARIAKALGAPEASVSARLRDLRKKRFGAFHVERRRVDGRGTFEYRVVR